MGIVRPEHPTDRIPPDAQERLVAFLGDVDLLASGPAGVVWIQRCAGGVVRPPDPDGWRAGPG
ncbi:MAG: hypothetical protein R2834_04175 [Rhodothermales bacterium]